MTRQEMFELYKAAYKQADDNNPGLWSSFNMKKPAPRPLPPAPGISQKIPGGSWYTKIQRMSDAPLAYSPITVNTGINPAASFQNRRTWETGTASQYNGKPYSWGTYYSGQESEPGNGAYYKRQRVQAEALQNLSNALQNGVSVKTQDAYHPENGSFNMSREAMLRRIDAILRQKKKDERIRKANYR